MWMCTSLAEGPDLPRWAAHKPQQSSTAVVNDLEGSAIGPATELVLHWTALSHSAAGSYNPPARR